MSRRGKSKRAKRGWTASRPCCTAWGLAAEPRSSGPSRLTATGGGLYNSHVATDPSTPPESCGCAKLSPHTRGADDDAFSRLAAHRPAVTRRDGMRHYSAHLRER
jgi:hypothetical protein